MPSNTSSLLQVRGLSCERDGRALFTGVNFALKAGNALQLEGSNGVGKSTLIRTLIGNTKEYHGEILWRGKLLPGVLPQLRQSLLYIGHSAGIRRGLTVLENLLWYGAKPAEALEALARLKLCGFEYSLCGELSAGQLRRVALARLFLDEAPVLWMLDEPLMALDVHGVAVLEARMAQHLSSGGVILLTSHQPVALSPLERVDLTEHIGDPEVWHSEIAYGT